MSPDTQVRVSLVETGSHQTLHSCLAADQSGIDAMVRSWLALGSSRAGRTEVVLRVVHHPPAEPPL